MENEMNFNNGGKEMLSQFVTFNLDSEIYGFPIQNVREIIRPQQITSIPLVANFVEGFTNLRGSLLLVVNGRNLFEMPYLNWGNQTRIIVLGLNDRLIGYVVDNVIGVKSIEMDNITQFDIRENNWISGVSKNEEENSVLMLLDSREVFSQAVELDSLSMNNPSLAHIKELVNDKNEENQNEKRQYVRFNVGIESYGLSVQDVRDIVRLPERIERLPGAPSYLLGLGVLRDQILPIIHLSRLLGIDTNALDHKSRVVLVDLEYGSKKITAGLAVDSVNEVLRLLLDDIRDLPSVLKMKQTDSILGVYQSEKNELMYVLDLKVLIPWDEVDQFLASNEDGTNQETNALQDRNDKMDAKQQVLTDDELYLIFKLGKEEFGLPVKGVKEVLRVPAISQIPNAPHYLVGLANIRGQFISVSDLSKRLEIAKVEESQRQRAVIAEFNGHQIGFIVDQIHEVRRIKNSMIEKTTDSIGIKNSKYVKKVANLSEDRMVLILDLSIVSNFE